METRFEDLRKWFGKGKKGDWVRVGTDGEIKGDCAREPGEGKPKCMPRSKAHSMDKKDRASSARRKRRADPSVDRPGTGNKPIMVKTDKRESVEMNEAPKVPAGMKFIASYVYKDANGKDHTHRHLRKGTKMTDPVVVYIDGKEWKTFQSFTKAKQAAINHIKGMKESVEMQEKTKWKMGDGRPRNGARIQNDRFWNLPRASLEYIRKDAHAAMKANPNGKKAGKYADEVNDAETVLAWRKKNGIRESVEMNEQFVVKYAKNKRGPIYQTKFKTQPEAEKFLAQKRKEGMNGIVSKAGKPVSMQKMADLQKEEVELDEAADLMKMSKELLKHKNKGVNYEKAAAYVRAIHNNSAVSVQDKAMKGLLDLLKNMDLTDRTTITKILKDNGFKMKGGRLMREEVESLDENYRTLARHGMGTETKNSARVGTEIDYYDATGSKRMGKITKMGPKSYMVKDDKDGKVRQFTYHDRVKAKELLAKHGKGKYNESVDLEEKNVPTNPALWAKMKAQAKAKFDVYPSAYANGWAAKKYKAAGGSWKTESVKETKSFWDIREKDRK